MASGQSWAGKTVGTDAAPCVGKLAADGSRRTVLGVPTWAGHRPQAVLGVGEWQCRDCDVKMHVDQQVWAEWVRDVILRADELLGEE